MDALPLERKREAIAYEGVFSQRFADLLQELENANDDKAWDFRGFEFPRLDLPRKVFPRGVRFENAVFHQETDFSWAVFEGEVDFSQAKFRATPTFNEATFKATAKFHDTKFENGATFIGTVFEGRVLLWDAYFEKQPTLFSYVTFKQGAKFANVTFASGVSFKRATFHEETTFFLERANQPQVQDAVQYECFSDGCNFQGIKQKKDSILVFDKVNLEKATFLDTDVKTISFRSVRWFSPKIVPHRRRALWDEFRTQTGERDYDRIAENYSQLVLNYEGKRDFDAAEDFHVGEMEVRRKAVAAAAKKRSWRKGSWWLNSYLLYRISNNYGTSYWQGLMILVVMLAIFSGAMLLAGFRASKESAAGPSAIIEYNLWPDANHHSVSAREWLSDYKEAVLFSLSIITFQRERFYEPLAWESRLILFVGVLILTSQLAMTLLAVRRRFKR
jgi:uncharacterized protein YjbI with pentapeptide repeats